MKSSDAACFYYFGHGTVEGGFSLWNKEVLTPKEIKDWLKERRYVYGGFAFLNCCWSAAASVMGCEDLARSLITAGYSTVVGTMLPPLDIAAAKFAERIFGKVIGYNCNIHDAFFDIIETEWKNYKDSEKPAAESFMWSVYRLYGVINEMYLWTHMTRPNGNISWLVNNQENILKIEDFLKCSDEATKKEIFEVFEKEPTETAFELFRNESLRHLAIEALQVFPLNGSFPFPENIQGVAEDLLARVIRGKQYEVQHISISSVDIDQALHEIVREKCPIGGGWKLESADQHLIRFDQSTAFKMSRILNKIAKGLDATRIYREEQRIQISDNQQTALWREIHRGNTELASLILTALNICEERKGSNVKIVDLFKSALVWGLAEGLALPRKRWEYPNNICENVTLECIDDDVLNALWDAIFGIDLDKRQPLWWRVLAALADNEFEDVLKPFGELGSTFEKMIRRVEDIVAVYDVSILKPKALTIGVPVGKWSLKLQDKVLNCWQENIQRAAELLCEANKRRVVLAVPWDCPERDALVDAIALEIRERFHKLEPRRRSWIHVNADHLFDNLHRSLFHPTTPMDQILDESRNSGILVVLGGNRERAECWAKWKLSAQKLLDKLDINDLGFLFVISKQEAEIEERQQFFSAQGIELVKLDSLGLDAIMELVSSCELIRGHRPNAGALKSLRQGLEPLDENKRLSEAIKIWERSRQKVNGGAPSSKDIEFFFKKDS